MRWLDAERPLRELALDLGQRHWRLWALIAYEREPIERVCRDARLVRLAACQARRRVLSGEWPCAEGVAVRLAALHLQAEHGDNDDVRAVVRQLGGLGALLPAPLLAARRESDAYWEGRLSSLLAPHRALTYAPCAVCIFAL